MTQKMMATLYTVLNKIDNMVYMPYNIYKGDYMTEFKLIAYEKENGDSSRERYHA